MVQIRGEVKNRSGGRRGGAKDIMEKHPRWPEFICSFTGWPGLEPGTLTLDNCQPLPLSALSGISCLAIEPPGLFENDSSYENLMRRRGNRRFYCGMALAGKRSQIVVVGQQEKPAVEHRLEVYAQVKLRDKLCVETGDIVLVEIYNKETWPDLCSGT